LRLVIFGGEALELNALKPWFERHGEQRPQLVNMYGITETTVHVTYRPLRLSDLGSHSVIGGALPDLKVGVLDRQMRLAPAGVAGELYVGGAGLGRGYLNRPELTAERFLPDPFSTRPGARLYKTGDVARLLPNGDLEYLGRADDQIKIRGFRVELGEIEAVLNQHDSVAEAVVVRQEGIESRLAAYVVSAHPSLTTTELRAYIKDKLPDYMIPSIFVLLDRMPMTPSGKVDRRALQVREQDTPTPKELFLAPRDVMEFQLSQIWEDVLGVAPIGVKDNFFELGGHSFLAVRLMAQIKAKTGKSLPLALLMQEGTIESLATELRQRPEPASHSPLVAIRREGNAPAFFCVHPAGGNVLCYAALAQHLGPGRPFYGFQARGLEDGKEPHTTIEAAASYYVEAMRAVQPEGPYLIGGWSIGGLIAFEMARLLYAQQQQIALLALFDSYLVHEKQIEEDEAALLINSALHLGLPLEHLPALRADLRPLDPEAQLNFALEHLRRLNLLPPVMEDSQVRSLIRVFKANLQAARDYSPHASSGRLTLFKASEPLGESATDPAEDWISLAMDGVEVREIPGDHFAIMREPHVRILAEHLNECLQQALESVHV
jgi:thioesterase domain-containing protein/acyl carrier protein